MKSKAILFAAVGFVVLCLAVYGVHKVRSHYRLAEHQRQVPAHAPDAQFLPTQFDFAPKAAPASAPENQGPPLDQTPPILREAYDRFAKNDLDGALEKLNTFIQSNPNVLEAYNARGSIYTQKKLWAQAKEDFTKAHQLDSKNSVIEFNLAETDFMQKEYDAARPGFVSLQKDSDLGDLAAYKVFLCDLYGGHVQEASNELAAFNQAGSNASYYFSNIAWDLYHQKPEDARRWLISTTHIYPASKNELYSTTLKELGYLPLPPAPAAPN